jgi:Fe-S cluster biogenesis protein NfuA
MQNSDGMQKKLKMHGACGACGVIDTACKI